MSDQTLAIIGLGYVGLPLAILASVKGYQVIGIDINSQKVDLINKGQSPFLDEQVEAGLKSARLTATTDSGKVSDADIVIICVPTPVFKNRLPDYRPVESACKGISPYIRPGQLIVLESTVNPGVCEEIMIPILQKGSGLLAGRDFYVAHCPERINPGDKQWNVSNISRVVGGLDQKSLDLAYDFYTSIISNTIKKMGSLKEAEAVKVVENSFRNINIAFVNELSQSFAKLGIDVVNVIDGCATKPFSFMAHYPGCGIGGHCIPVDPYYLIDYAKKHGYTHKFLSLACEINEQMPDYTVRLAVDRLAQIGLSLSDARVAVLGLSYKADIDDCRESPALKIIKSLSDLKAQVVTYDPYVKSSTAASLSDALSGSSVAIVVTSHREFRNLHASDFQKNGVRIVIDGRNCLDQKEFASTDLLYSGIGR